MHFLRAGRVPAPEIDAADWAGDALPLGPLRGRVVLLDFFSYADPGSVLTLDRIRGLGEHYRESGLVVLGLHVPAYAFERVPEDARREIWRLGIPHPVALDRDFGVFRRYGLANLPARVLVD
ncbi:redoxin domain-containing protein, partial [bacterium]|nr:redoxin domain-containing protein [bacterium]